MRIPVDSFVRNSPVFTVNTAVELARVGSGDSLCDILVLIFTNLDDTYSESIFFPYSLKKGLYPSIKADIAFCGYPECERMFDLDKKAIKTDLYYGEGTLCRYDSCGLGVVKLPVANRMSEPNGISGGAVWGFRDVCLETSVVYLVGIVVRGGRQSEFLRFVPSYFFHELLRKLG